MRNWLRWVGGEGWVADAAEAEVTLVGFPFRATGRGEHLRAIFRAMTAAGLRPLVYDLGGGARDIRGDKLLRSRLIRRVPANGLRLFHCNGDEAADAIKTLERSRAGLFSAGYNIIYPAWELPKYPPKWAEQLNRYSEVWAATQFVFDGLRDCVSVPLRHIHNACQPTIETALTRGDFGLDDQDYLVLFFFDYWSYSARKNPMAAIAAFRAAAVARPNARLRLVVKSHHSADHPMAKQISDAVAEMGGRATLIDRTVSDNEVKNLIALSDCFLSMHRSEGFGRGPAEAMFFGKPVIATGWSGNMDYMTPEVSFPIGYRLVPVVPGEYIEGDGQVWADPDVGAATEALLRLVDDPALGKEMGAKAALHMQQHFGDAALGRIYEARLDEIQAGRAGGV